MTRMCKVCGATFKIDRSAYRHVQLSHYVPDDFVRYYVTKVDITVKAEDGDDVEIELVN